MSKRKAGNNEFSTEEKVAILRDIDVIGNVSKVAEKWGVSRQTIYNWKSEREKLDEQIVIEKQIQQVKESSKFDSFFHQDNVHAREAP
jgi:transposase-like protein